MKSHLLRTVCLVGAALSVVGCAAPQHNYRPVEQAVSFPPLNTVQEAVVGDEMVRQGRFTTMETLYLPAVLTVSFYTVSPGYYAKIGSSEEGEFFRPGAGRDGGHIAQPPLLDAPQALLVKPNGNLCIVTVYNGVGCGGNGGYERRKRDAVTETSFQQTLIYNGRVGKKINIAYREFSNSMARPAFNNNVEYDLEESKHIAYRGAQIEILDATNRSIKYRLLRNFNTPQQ